MPVHTLAIDIETYSETDIKAGVYKYASDPAFEILIISYKLNDLPTELLALDNPESVAKFKVLLQDPDILKTAFNVPFERTCFSIHYKMDLPADQWACTMATAYQCGMSGGLDQVAGILKVGHKMPEGRSLINYFCKPCKPTILNKGRTRNLPHHEPAKWAKFQQYCIEDTNLEYKIRHILSGFTQPAIERPLWILDQKINDRGIRVDTTLMQQAIDMDAYISGKALDRLIEITGISSGKAIAQLKKWLMTEMEETEEITSLDKEAIPKIIARTDNALVHEVLKLRQQTGKTSVSKYEAMKRYLLSDERVKGLFQFCGAARTGRWAGRGIQLHNLPKTDLPGLDDARKLVRKGDLEGLQMCFDNISVSYILSQLIRTAFIPKPGHVFRVADYSAIEARVIAWLAGEGWRLDVFTGHGKIYEASAAAMFGVPLESVTKGSDLRQAGKVSELALGYQGAVGALQIMLRGERVKAIEQGKKFDYAPSVPEMEELVKKWRAANPNIVKYWYHVNDCAIEAVNNPGAKVSVGKGIYYQVKQNVLFCTLPSGRKLCYLRPRMVEGKFGMTLSYEGIEQNGKKTWGRLETYGGKLVENIVQAVSRDLLADAMVRLDLAGFNICLHVHDEVVLEEAEGSGKLSEINHIMKQPVLWAPGLPLGVESFETYYYKKE